MPTTSDPTFRIHKLSSSWGDSFGRLASRSLQILIVGMLASFLVFGMLKMTMIVIPALIAVIIACSMWPLVTRLRQVFTPLLSAWIAFLGSLLMLSAVGAALISSVIQEWPHLVNQAGLGFGQLGDMARDFAGTIPIGMDEQKVDELVAATTDFLVSDKFGVGALNTITAAGSFLTGSLLLLVILFFLLKDGDKIWIFIVSWTPKHVRATWSISGNRAVRTFGGYVRGTALIAAVDALGITITLLILKVPLAIPLGVIVFLGSFVPLVGATVAGVLATLIALVTNGPFVALIVLIAVVVVNQLEGNFLQPVVMANALNLHALVVLMALTAGTILGGVVGAVIAVPLTAAGWAVIKVWTGRDDEIDVLPLLTLEPVESSPPVKEQLAITAG